VRRVYVVDDHAIVREGLRAWLGQCAQLCHAGDSETAEDLLAQVAASNCDAVVLDLSLLRWPGIEQLRDLRRAAPGLIIVVYSMYPAESYSRWALEAGASHYVSKASPLSELEAALTASADSSVQQAITPPARSMLSALTDREREVVRAIAEGKSPSEIAWTLGMARTTVSTHLKSIRDKLGLRTAAELMQYVAKQW
jgi:two-component system, NarL family, invasion response regulator UvrY